MSRVCKACFGCQSSETQGGITYYQCRNYLGHQAGIKRLKLFREKFCPCVTCIVKVTCSDPKIQQIGYATQAEEDWGHKCIEFHKQRRNLWAYVRHVENGEALPWNKNNSPVRTVSL